MNNYSPKKIDLGHVHRSTRPKNSFILAPNTIKAPIRFVLASLQYCPHSTRFHVTILPKITKFREESISHILPLFIQISATFAATFWYLSIEIKGKYESQSFFYRSF
jgi:hypothetical protein